MACPAVLFLVFDRPEHAARVFEAIRLAQPSRLYVAADGPRAGSDAEQAQRCATARKLATQVDWPCEVQTLFREQNLGCKRAVSGAIDWFFEREEQGIILEDDCVPHPDFFGFCDAMLHRYADDRTISTITGDNFQRGQRRGLHSYYFSRYPHCWGWASWRRAWASYQGHIPFWRDFRASPDWGRWLEDPLERNYWESIFDRVERGELDSWAYPWTACVWKQGGLTVTPNVNLVRNIGFGEFGTHTVGRAGAKDVELSPMGPLDHPDEVVVDRDADRFTFRHHFGGRLHRWPWRALALVPHHLSGLFSPGRSNRG